jgi:4-hydroxy-3-methylbut-2-en-1-yl diphosphate synthase IspG/GcpE
VVADIERRLERYEDPIEVAVLGCAVNGIGEASHADFGIAGAKNEGLIFSRGKPLKKVPQERLVDDVDAEAAAALRGPERAPGHTKVHMRSVQRHTRRSHWATGD